METIYPNRVRVGAFEFDLKAGEIRAGDGKVRRLQEQPFQILLMLIERSGGLVTREEIQKRLWPNDTVVEFNHSIYTAINKLRQAFEDSAEDSNYIETVGRRGYRLMVPVERIVVAAEPAIQNQAVLPEPEKAEFKVGSLTGQIVSHYRVLEIIGGGGMGLVYRAEDLKLGRTVALKFLPDNLSNDPKALARFEREARAVSAVSHPNICPIYEFDEYENQPFLVMELLHGKTLREHLADGAFRLSDPAGLDIAIQVASGLDAAHEQGIIHRDIKPANIFITEKNVAKILDFGVAKVLEASEPQELAAVASQEELSAKPVAPNLTRTGLKLGTAGYMSPEQVSGELLDARTDLFSFGLVLYEMCTGRRAFAGATVAGVHEEILNRPATPVRELNPGVAPGLEAIIGRALEKDRERRYQTAAEIEADLQRLRAKEKRHSRVSRKVSFAGALLLATVLLLPSAMYLRSVRKALPFQKFEMSQLTNGGKELLPAISPDGKYVAYVSTQFSHFTGIPAYGHESLWLRQISGSEVQILPPANVDYRTVTFSSDGQYLYFLQTEAGTTSDSGTLYRIPVLGGRPQRLVSDVDTPPPITSIANVALSPDAKRLAFERTLASKKQSVLVAANEDGAEARTLISRPASQGCAIPAWSPDGTIIAAFCGSRDNKVQLFWVSAAGGPERPVSDRLWAYAYGAAWLSDGRGLIVNVQDANGVPSHFAYVPYPSGEVRQLTNDLNLYLGLSLTADSRTIATIQKDYLDQLWTVPFAEPEHAKTVSTGGWAPGWTATGSIVYVLDTVKRRSVGIMDAAGSNVQELSDGSDVMVVEPRPSPDNRYIVFEGDRSGVMQVWRIDINGEHPVQLTRTNDVSTSGLEVSYDSKWVFYGRQINADIEIWKVPIEGGDPVAVASKPALHTPGSYLTVSPNGEFLAYTYVDSSVEPARGVAVLPLKTSSPPRLLGTPADCVRWTPDSRALLYSAERDGVSNIWMQALVGGPPRQITHFSSDRIHSFDLSKDGRQLVVAREITADHVVLIRDIQ
jgi:serine/threonine protein kinase